jgi:5'-deoxynucleotidase YfbR-like HD superfamily hydrolase
MTDTDNRQRGQRRRRARERRERCVLTHSGLRVDLRNPDPATITLSDIARGLAACRRYAGRGLSVAEHSVLVCRRLRELEQPPDVQLAGLLHDAAEYVTGDVTRPTKACLRGFRALEDRIDSAILSALGLEHLDLHAAVVKRVDREVLEVEAGRDPLSAKAARRAWLREYQRLVG